LHLATGIEVFAALAKWSAWLNLFNLTPVWQLDGSHAFKALTRWERLGVAAMAIGMWTITHEGWLLLICLIGAVRAFFKDAAQKTDLPIFAEFLFLILTLSLLTQIGVDLGGR
jgi:Zn-dependent protease